MHTSVTSPTGPFFMMYLPQWAGKRRSKRGRVGPLRAFLAEGGAALEARAATATQAVDADATRRHVTQDSLAERGDVRQRDRLASDGPGIPLAHARDHGAKKPHAPHLPDVGNAGGMPTKPFPVP